MSTISNKVRYYHSGMTDAPVLSGTAGALIAVLDACLVNGFGVKTINNLTVTDGIAVAHISSGHTFGEGDVLRIAGVTGALAGLNDDWRLASVTADTVTWSVEGLSIPAGSATGTITCLRAPAGWEKVFSATNRAAYRSLKHAEHNGLFLYVDDTGTTTARVRGYEAMTDIDTGTGPFPTDAQLSGGLWAVKAHSTGSRSWFVVADAERHLIAIAPTNAGYSLTRYSFFGGGLLLPPRRTSDNHAHFVFGQTSSSASISYPGNGAATGNLAASNNQTVGAFFARSISGADGSVAARSHNFTTTFSGSPQYPDTALQEPVWAMPVLLCEGIQSKADGALPRGRVPGLSHLRERPTNMLGQWPVMQGVPGNGTLIVEVDNGGGGANYIAVDLGPWQ